MYTRHIGVTIALFLSVLFLPYYIYVPAVFISLILIVDYYEAIFLAVLIDVLYGTPLVGNLYGFPFGVMALVCILVLVPLRSKLRSYA